MANTVTIELKETGPPYLGFGPVKLRRDASKVPVPVDVPADVAERILARHGRHVQVSPPKLSTAERKEQVVLERMAQEAAAAEVRRVMAGGAGAPDLAQALADAEARADRAEDEVARLQQELQVLQARLAGEPDAADEDEDEDDEAPAEVAGAAVPPATMAAAKKKGKE